MQNRKVVSLIVILTTVALLTCAMFFLLYKFDNKYTQKSIQPISGLLFLSEEDLEEDPIRYLIREWEVYPGKLFSPTDFNNTTPDSYRKYTYIGEYTGMNMGNHELSSHGSATYKLLLNLPSPQRSYAIEIPEIFSSYKLYINDSLVEQLGDPSTDSYKAGIQNNIIHFAGEGKVQLILAVSDYSGIYSGLTYPPAFGLADDVVKAREIWFFFHLAGILLAAFGCFFSCYLTIAGRRFQGLLFFLCCFFFIIMTAAPVIHCFIKTSFQPWYTLEISSYYMLLLLAILIMNSIFKIPKKANFISALPCGIVWILFFIYGAGAHLWSLPIEDFFSYISSIIKQYTAIYLIGLSIYSLVKRQNFSIVFLCASTVLAIALIFDRLFPLYEPIYGGWFNEIGYGLLVLTMAGVLWVDFASSYKEKIILRVEKLQIEHLLHMQSDHYSQLSEQISATRHATHDLRHHMRMLNTWAQQKKLEEIQSYLEKYVTSLSQQEILSLSNNHVIDGIAQYYKLIAEKFNIKYEARLILGENSSLQDVEMCILLSNLLENAVEECRRQLTMESSDAIDSAPPFIYLFGEENSGGMFKLIIENSLSNETKKKSSLTTSHKGANHGIGLRSVKALVEKHNGILDINSSDNIFSISIVIPGKII